MIKILLVAGEVSGDSHGAELVRELKKLDSKISIFGIGGDSLKMQGMEILFHIKDMAFLGIGEIIRHLPFIRRVHQTLISRIKSENPVCAILIDYPGFNLRLAKSLKKSGIPVVYYISPQLWAWGKGRVKKIRRYVDKMLVLFPFEKKFYQRHNIEAEYVGHPLVDKHSRYLPKETKKINPGQIVIGLLPGSRRQEVTSLLPKMIQTARILYREEKINQAEIVKVKHLPLEIYQALLDKEDRFIKIVETPLENNLPRYDAVIAASGTVTLEAGYFCVPMLIVYHVNELTYWLGRLLINVDYIGLANIVAETQAAVELIQRDFTPLKAAQIMKNMLIPEENLSIRQKLTIIKDKLGTGGASSRSAREVWGFIQKQR